MLAQAVEGQRDEQREVAGVLGDMRNQLLRLGQEIAEMRASGGSDGGDASTINNVTVELREAVRFLSERLDGVTRMVAQRGEDLADIRGALTTIDAHVGAQGETIGMLSQGLQALPSYGERVSALHDDFERVHQRLGELQAAVERPTDTGRIEQRLTSIEAAMAPVADHLTQSRQVAADHTAALADQTATIAAQAAAMAEHRSSLEALHERIDSLAAGTQAALAVPPVFDDTTIAALDTQLSAVATQIESLSRDVAELVESGGGGGTAGSAAGSAAGLDASEVTAAVAAAEQRLRTHVDEAVVALAEMLLRRRLTAPAYDPIEPRPGGSAAAVDDEAPIAADPSDDDPSDDYDEPDLPAAVAVPVVADHPDDEQPMVDFSVADIDDEEAEDSFEDELFDGGPAEPTYPSDVAEASDGETEDMDDETDPEPNTSSWSPEVPSDRPQADPSETMASARKRRWFKG